MSAPSKTSSAHTAIIHADALTKTFRDFWHRVKVKAVNGVSFDVQPGEVFGLLGPNGSGKSTTLKMAVGLLRPTGGTLQVLDASPGDVSAQRRLGYLPEETWLYPFLTAEEILTFYGRLFNLAHAERQARIDQLLDMVGLAHARRRPVGEFSKGMARRIGLAQALINDPDLVILDEPTSGLDPVGCRQIKDLLRTLARRGKTVVVSSHLLADVEDVCDRIAIMCNGTVCVQGQVRDLLEEKDRTRLTFPTLPPETLSALLSLIRRDTGLEPSVDHPLRPLEQLFLDIVEHARRQSPASTGVAHAEGVAPYLTGPE